MHRWNKIKIIIGIVFFNVFVLWLFFANFYNGLPKKSENHIQINGNIDDIILITANKGSDYLNIFIDSEKYVLSEISEGTNKNLVKYVYENFNPGDFISIKYVTKLRLFSSYKIITEFSDDNQNYRTIEEYNNSKKNVATLYLILFLLFEFFNFSIFVFFLWCNRRIK